jgi:hypothetical protein
LTTTNAKSSTTPLQRKSNCTAIVLSGNHAALT